MDGLTSNAQLTNVNGVLYGTTSDGGIYGWGTVFSLNLTTASAKTVYSFCNLYKSCVDGARPVAGVINIKGVLYGTTGDGGPYLRGSIFSLNPTTGTEKILYFFCSQTNCIDGAGPDASLIYYRGALYGTTVLGGSNNAGTVFKIIP